MAKHKNKDLQKQLRQVIQESNNPWEMQQNVQKTLQTMGTAYVHSKPDNTAGKKPIVNPKPENSAEKKPITMPDYDINMLMDKLGDKMPPGIKQVLDQFIPMIPTAQTMNDPKFKKEMKKKMKSFGSVFQSPYE